MVFNCFLLFKTSLVKVRDFGDKDNNFLINYWKLSIPSFQNNSLNLSLLEANIAELLNFKYQGYLIKLIISFKFDSGDNKALFN
jgi:hypothetical protein